MLYKILSGPHTGKTCHFPQSQEIHALTLLGLLEPAEQAPTAPAPPPAGWRVVKLETSKRGFAIGYDDGLGNTLLCRTESGIPGPEKVWHFDPETGKEGYVFRKSTCPDSVVQEFLRLTGAVVDIAEVRRQEREQIKEAMAKQSAPGNRLW